MKCSNCNSEMTPRIVYKDGSANEGVCPYCGNIIWTNDIGTKIINGVFTGLSYSFNFLKSRISKK